MGLINVTEKPNSRKYSIDSKRQPKWEKRYTAQVDPLAPNDDPDTWELPYQIGDAWTNGENAATGDVVKTQILCDNITAEEAEDGKQIELVFAFGRTEAVAEFYERWQTQAPDPDGGTNYPGSDPLDWRPQISYDWLSEQVAAQAGYAYAGAVESRVPITNSAGDVFSPAPTQTRQIRVINISRIETYDATDMAMWEGLKQSTNSAAVTIDGIAYPVRSLLMEAITPRRYYLPDSAAWIWDVSYRILVDFELLHQTQLLDQGYYKLVGGVRTPILDASGQPVAVPVLLNGSGDVLAAGGTPVFRTFELKPRRNWAGLALPA
jgi:hypothetical protein